MAKKAIGKEWRRAKAPYITGTRAQTPVRWRVWHASKLFVLDALPALLLRQKHVRRGGARVCSAPSRRWRAPSG
eukprot:5444271-Pleurochrysis_carterae.AAC.3